MDLGGAYPLEQNAGFAQDLWAAFRAIMRASDTQCPVCVLRVPARFFWPHYQACRARAQARLKYGPFWELQEEGSEHVVQQNTTLSTLEAH